MYTAASIHTHTCTCINRDACTREVANQRAMMEKHTIHIHGPRTRDIRTFARLYFFFFLFVFDRQFSDSESSRIQHLIPGNKISEFAPRTGLSNHCTGNETFVKDQQNAQHEDISRERSTSMRRDVVYSARSFKQFDAATYTNNGAGFSNVLLVTLRGLWRIRATILARVMLRRKLSLHEYPSMQIPLWH